MLYLNNNYGSLKNEVLPLPRAIDEKVARYKLEAMGITIDRLSEEQLQYLRSWETGTGGEA